MSRVRTAVVGCGHLGRIHARLLAELDGVELVAVADPDENARSQVAEECGTTAVADFKELLGSIDAAVVAAPTSHHPSIARRLMESGVHLLVEKPLAPSHGECELLVQLADQRDVVLAVGHVERFNPAFVAAEQQIQEPLYIEATRTSGFTFRSLDVGVVLDLMIHDLELVLALVDSSITSVSAVGAPVITAQEDFAEARIVFGNGCVAELKASRTSPIAERRMTIYGSNQHLFVDFGERRTRLLERSTGLQQGTLCVERLGSAEIATIKDDVFHTLLPTSEVMIAQTNPLQDELIDFIAAIRCGRKPRVDGRHASRAVWLAEQIVAQIRLGSPLGVDSTRRRAA